MKVIYVTANVLGDAGANAAEIFPRLAMASEGIEKVIVADFGKNRDFIKEKQFCDFLCLRRYGAGLRLYAALRQGLRIAKKSTDEEVDIIHIFYRQRSIPLLVFLRVGLFFCVESRSILWITDRST